MRKGGKLPQLGDLRHGSRERSSLGEEHHRFLIGLLGANPATLLFAGQRPMLMRHGLATETPPALEPADRMMKHVRIEA
jgi:hypothetical protein